MNLFIQCLLVITYVAGTFCQKITFDNTDIGGVTVGRFYIDGTIGENVTELLQQNWQSVILILLKEINNPQLYWMCQFHVSGATCIPNPVDKCQCVYNTTTDNVHFVVSGTAFPEDYNAVMWAEWKGWQNENFTTVYSNKNYTVPGPKVSHTDDVEHGTGSDRLLHHSNPPPPITIINTFICIIFNILIMLLISSTL